MDLLMIDYAEFLAFDAERRKYIADNDNIDAEAYFADMAALEAAADEYEYYRAA